MMANRSVYRLLAVCLLMLLVRAQAQQVEGCQNLLPPKADTSLSGWLLQKEKAFKQQGCWQQHLDYGVKALQEAEKQQQSRVVMKLSLQLASSSFYLGQYAKAQSLAEKGYSLAVTHNDIDAQIEGLYLLSAVARTQQSPTAIELSEKALYLYRQQPFSDKPLEAKIYMNLGAAYSDVPPPDLDFSRQYLQKAYILFLDQEQQHDALRAGLRLVRVDYLLNQLDRAQKFLESLSLLVDNPRSEMLYGYQMGKVLHRQKQWGEAGSYAIKAKKLAVELDASKDMERLDALLIAINQRRFVEEEVPIEK